MASSIAAPGNGPACGLSFLLLRSRRDLPEWPRYREGAKQDERRWIELLSDRELAEHAAALHHVDKAVKDANKGKAA